MCIQNFKFFCSYGEDSRKNPMKSRATVPLRKYIYLYFWKSLGGQKYPLKLNCFVKFWRVFLSCWLWLEQRVPNLSRTFAYSPAFVSIWGWFGLAISMTFCAEVRLCNFAIVPTYLGITLAYHHTCYLYFGISWWGPNKPPSFSISIKNSKIYAKLKGQLKSLQTSCAGCRYGTH